MLTKVSANDRNKIVEYWTRSLRESMLRDPKLNNRERVKIEQVKAGRLAPDVVARIQASLKAGGKSEKTNSSKPNSSIGSSDPRAGQTSAAGETPHPNPLPVLVAPYLVVPVNRVKKDQPHVLFWVPARLMPDGALQAHPDQLPFVPRVLLDPPVTEHNGRRPTPIASWDEYDCATRAMGVDWQEGWSERLERAEEMFRSVAGVGASEWKCEGWQRVINPIVVPWDKDSGPAGCILPLCEAWLKKETLPGALLGILSPAEHGPGTVESAIEGDVMHLGHYGDHPLNRNQRDAVRAIRLLEEGRVQAVNGPPGTGKTSLLKTLIADAVVNAAAAGDPAPCIVIASTNNDAVINAAGELKIADADGLPVERKRWLPGLRHFAAYNKRRDNPGSGKDANSSDLLLLKSLHSILFTPNYAEEAELHFLDRFKEWCLASGGTFPQHVDLTFAKAILRERLHEVIATIKTKAELIAKAERFVLPGDVPTNITEVRFRLNRTQTDANAAERNREDLSNQHRKAIHTLDSRGNLHPLWMRWVSFLPPIEARRAALLRQTATALKYLPKDDISLDSRAKLYAAVDAEFGNQIDAEEKTAPNPS
ncbi:MAG: AAA family ATPase [Verrucomicrobia bacterium]|nr:AAA family ATPase [Verrucomicrobiota bacterium]